MRGAAFAKGDIFLFDSMSNWSIAFQELGNSWSYHV